MKKKTLIIILSIAALSAVIICGTLIWFFSEGIHTLLWYTNVDISVDAFLVDRDNDTKTPVCVQAFGVAKDTNGNGVEPKQDCFSISVDGLHSITAKSLAGATVYMRTDDIREIGVIETIGIDGDMCMYQLMVDAKTSAPLLLIYIYSEDGITKTEYIVFDESHGAAYINDFLLPLSQ